MNNLKVRHYFDASHQLTDGPDLVTKACARLHGHTYAVIVDASSSSLNSAGMVIDFKAIKKAIDALDHRHVNDVFKQNNVTAQPTAENIAIFIADKVMALGVEVSSVSVCEGYKGENRASWAVYVPDL